MKKPHRPIFKGQSTSNTRNVVVGVHAAFKRGVNHSKKSRTQF